MSRWIPFLLAFAALHLGSPPGAAAQQQLLQPGVRARFPGIGEGLVVQRSGDSIMVSLKDGIPLMIATNALSTFQLRGEKDRTAGAVRGALWGAGFGVAGGVALWATGDSTSCRRISRDTWEEYDCSRTYGAGDALLSTIGGTAIGAGIGALIGRRTWRTFHVTPVTTTVAVHALPARRIGFRVSVAR